MSDIEVGQTRTVFPPEGVESINVMGNQITSQGVPVEITKQLLTLHEKNMIRIGDASGNAPASQAPAEEPQQEPQQQPAESAPTPPQPSQEQQPAPAQEQAQAPAPQPQEAPKQTAVEPANQSVPSVPGSLPSADDVDRMSDEQLREFVSATGHEVKGQRRQYLVRLAKSYLENVKA